MSVLAALRKADGGSVQIDGPPVFGNTAAMERVCFRQADGELLLRKPVDLLHERGTALVASVAAVRLFRWE